MISGAAAMFAATNVNLPLPAVEQSVKQVRVFEDYTLENMKRVFFESGRSEIGSQEATALSHLLKEIRANNQSVIELRAYADGAESAEEGIALSSSRAQSVALYFADHGVPFDRIRLLRFQEIEDVGAASNPERRRVDVRIFVPPASGRH
jgi:outer membrane protein OmpA-like peptidoglycan-associated protein